MSTIHRYDFDQVFQSAIVETMERKKTPEKKPGESQTFSFEQKKKKQKRAVKMVEMKIVVINRHTYGLRKQVAKN